VLAALAAASETQVTARANAEAEAAAHAQAEAAAQAQAAEQAQAQAAAQAAAQAQAAEQAQAQAAAHAAAQAQAAEQAQAQAAAHAAAQAQAAEQAQAQAAAHAAAQAQAAEQAQAQAQAEARAAAQAAAEAEVATLAAAAPPQPPPPAPLPVAVPSPAIAAFAPPPGAAVGQGAGFAAYGPPAALVTTGFSGGSAGLGGAGFGGVAFDAAGFGGAPFLPGAGLAGPPPGPGAPVGMAEPSDVVLRTSRGGERSRSRTLLLAVIALLVVVVAAGIAMNFLKKAPSPTSAAAVAAPSGAIQLNSRGISDSVPAGWHVLTLQAKTLRSYATAEARTNPVASRFYAALEPGASSGLLRMVAAHVGTPGGGLLSVAYVVVEPIAATPSLATEARELRAGLRAHGGFRGIATEAATLRQGRALKVTAIEGRPGQLSFRVTQYYLKQGNELVTFNLLSKTSTTDQGAFLSMVDSFRLT